MATFPIEIGGIQKSSLHFAASEAENELIDLL
jgi:hypothetical protein